MSNFLTHDRAFTRGVFALLGPIILQNLVSASLSLADTIMVGALGQTQLSGLTLANTPFYVAMLFVFGLQSGGAVLISQYWGRRDINAINRVMGVSTAFAGVVSFVFAAVIFFFPQAVMSLTTNNAVLADIAARYGRIVAFSWFLHSLVMVFVGAQRSTENPRFGMLVLLMSMLLNVFLNFVLIYGKLGFPALGVEGAAWATLISRGVEFLVTMVYSVTNKRLPFRRKYFFRPGRTIVKDFLKYAAPVVLNETLWGLGTSAVPVIYGHMAQSVDIVAAHSVTGNIEKIITVITLAVAHATAVYIGKAVGAGAASGRVTQLGKWFFRLALWAGVAALVLLLILLFAFVRPVLYPWIGLTPYAAETATVMLLALGVMMPIRARNTTAVVGVLRGGGDVRAALLIDVLPLYLYTIPAAALMALVFGVDARIICVCLQVEYIIVWIAGSLRFRSGRWIRNVTRDERELE